MRAIVGSAILCLGASLATAVQATTTPMDLVFDTEPTTFSLGDGDTLEGVQNITTIRDISFDGMGTIDTAGYTVEFVGVLKGPSGFTKAGSGTVIISTAATFAGPVTVSDGVLQIDNGASIASLTADIVDNAQVVFDYGGLGTYAGSISGTGTLLLNGAGTTVFTGDVAMTGGTTLTTGTLQIGDGSGTGSISGTIVNDGQIVVNRTGTWTLSSDISGSGTLEVMAGGTTALTGTAAMTGGTTIDALGTLQIGGGGTTGSLSGSIVDNGTLAFDHSDDITFATVVTGTGGLQQLSSGTLTLTGNSTITGDTEIDAGSTLQLGNGGTTGSVASANFVNAGTLIFNRSDAVTFSGDFQGAGAVTKAGSGTLTLNGNTTGTGTITVSAGTLTIGDASHTGASVTQNVTVAAGGTMNGYGSVLGTLTDNGTVTLVGAVTSLQAGAYTQGTGGTLKLDIAPATADVVHVTNAANLSGTLALTSATGSYGSVTRTILDAASVSGGFTAITGAPAGEAAALIYGPTTVTLSLTPEAPAQLFADFDQTSFGIDRAIGDILSDRVFAHRCRVRQCDAIQFWVQGYHGVSDVDPDGTTAGFSSHDSGVIGGIDFLADSATNAGLFFGYQSGRMGVSGGAGSASMHSYVVGASAGAAAFGMRFDADFRYLVNKADTSRSVSGGPFTATASPRANITAGTVQVTFPLITGVAALARVSYASLSQDAFAETGAGNFDFTVDKESHSAGYADVGFHYSAAMALSTNTTLAPTLNAGFRIPLSSPSPALSVGLVNDALGSRFASQGPDRYETGGFASFGLAINGRNGLSLAVRANGEAASGHNFASVSVAGSMRF
ncbi:MAG: autotransporter domain-containing protein [Proteobacteria bacterium]|nr:autotransporter domain-containing protein [Pseudomonadota bacterium]